MVSQAAKSITNIFHSLYPDNLISRLSDTAIAALEPAVATPAEQHVRDTQNPRLKLPEVLSFVRVLLQTKQKYHLAEATMSMLDAAAMRSKSPPGCKDLKTTAFPHSMGEFASADVEFMRPYMAVPFVSVVGQQQPDQSDISTDWTKARRHQEASGIPLHVFGQYDHVSDVVIRGALEQSTFNQLMCWDELGEEFP